MYSLCFKVETSQVREHLERQRPKYKRSATIHLTPHVLPGDINVAGYRALLTALYGKNGTDSKLGSFGHRAAFSGKLSKIFSTTVAANLCPPLKSPLSLAEHTRFYNLVQPLFGTKEKAQAVLCARESKLSEEHKAPYNVPSSELDYWNAVLTGSAQLARYQEDLPNCLHQLDDLVQNVGSGIVSEESSSKIKQELAQLFRARLTSAQQQVVNCQGQIGFSDLIESGRLQREMGCQGFNHSTVTTAVREQVGPDSPDNLVRIDPVKHVIIEQVVLGKSHVTVRYSTSFDVDQWSQIWLPGDMPRKVVAPKPKSKKPVPPPQKKEETKDHGKDKGKNQGGKKQKKGGNG